MTPWSQSTARMRGVIMTPTDFAPSTTWWLSCSNESTRSIMTTTALYVLFLTCLNFLRDWNYTLTYYLAHRAALKILLQMSLAGDNQLIRFTGKLYCRGRRELQWTGSQVEDMSIET